MEELDFKLSGSCQFVDVFLGRHQKSSQAAQSGRLTGTWRWRFKDGTSGTTNVSGATTTQSTELGIELLGIIKINMFELDKSPPGSQLLFLSYESTDFQISNNTVTVVINGNFTGGTNKYADASGELTLTSINGLIKQGSGTLII